MKVPISYKIPSEQVHNLGKWLETNQLFGSVSYDWIKKVITFEHEQDAMAFALLFGTHRHYTKIDEMMREYADKHS